MSSWNQEVEVPLLIDLPQMYGQNEETTSQEEGCLNSAFDVGIY